VPNTSPTISRYLNMWLSARREAKSIHTFEASKNAAKAFLNAVGDIPLPSLTEDHYSKFLSTLKRRNPYTEQLYAALIYGWFVYLGGEEIKPLNMFKLKYIRENRQRHPGRRLRKFHRADIEKLKRAAIDFKVKDGQLTAARARAMVILSIETGLRVSELCKLRMRNLDFQQLNGTVIGKRDKERKFYFTNKSTQAIQDYLHMRKVKEPRRGRDLKPEDVPIFVSHSKRGHSKLEPMDTDTARLDLYQMVITFVGNPKYKITPHVLRHFAGNELRKVTEDLEVVRSILGHDSIATTQGYMHVEEEEAEKAYRKHFGNE
jgi:site-specific recombinase XerD